MNKFFGIMGISLSCAKRVKKKRNMACELDRILTMNVPHIPEKIFLSLDFKSFMNCLEVCKSWNDLLISETYQTKTKNVFWREIHYMLNSAAARGNLKVIQRVLSSFIVDINPLY